MEIAIPLAVANEQNESLSWSTQINKLVLRVPNNTEGRPGVSDEEPIPLG